MSKLMVYPKFRVVHPSTGLPLASGKVYTYITGTTTDKATYTDSAEGTPNANPVVLDANGEADIWCATDVEYKFVIKTSADTTLYTIDPISPIGNISTLEANLNTNGNSIVSTGANDLTIDAASGQNIVLDGMKFPNADGTANQVIETDGSNNLGFTAATSDVVSDTTPQLGADLDTNAFDIAFDNATGIRDESDNEQVMFQTTASAVNYIDITNAATGNDPIIAANGSDTNANLALAGKGTGAVSLSSLKYPTSDGTSSQIIVTDGAGNLSFATSGSTTFVQRQSASTAAVGTLTTVMPVDDTIPQNTEGDEIETVTITPSSSSNNLIITAYIPFCSAAAAATLAVALFQDSTAGSLMGTTFYMPTTNPYGPVYLQHIMTAGTTSATTFKLRGGPSASGTVYTLADNSGTRLFGGAATVYMTVDEYA